jgi:hypothetical protein
METLNAEEIMEWRRRLEESWTLVGEFMYNFAMVESALDDLIGAMMGLEILSTTILASNISVSKKINIAICGIQFQQIDRVVAINDLKSIREINNDRNTLANCVFGPTSSGDGVELHRATARNQLKIDMVVWKKADFRVKVQAMEKLHQRLKALIEAVSAVQSDEAFLQWFRQTLLTTFPGPDEDV